MTLSEIRKNSGLTQEQAAFKLGISCRTYTRWEHGDSCIRASWLPKLAKLFKVSVNQVLTAINSPKEALKTKKEAS